MSAIKNVIFDFGVVLYDLNQQATHLALAELGIKDAANIFTIQQQNNLCDQFETGKITPTQFFRGLQKLAGSHATEAQLKTAWEAMLLSLPQDKFLLLNELRKNYTTMVLSNTNSTHIEKVNTALQERYKLSSINDLFDRTYLSFEVGLRKPEPAVFNHVIHDAQINPTETLFIDDLDKNIAAAHSVGINAVLYKKGDDLKELLNKHL